MVCFGTEDDTEAAVVEAAVVEAAVVEAAVVEAAVVEAAVVEVGSGGAEAESAVVVAFKLLGGSEIVELNLNARFRSLHVISRASNCASLIYNFSAFKKM